MKQSICRCFYSHNNFIIPAEVYLINQYLLGHLQKQMRWTACDGWQ